MSKDKDTDDYNRCINCGMCHTLCPTYKVTKDESMAARGRLKMIANLMDSGRSPSKRFYSKISSCTGCRSCSEVCSVNIDPAGIINACRSRCYGSGNAGVIWPVLANMAANRGPSMEKLFRYLGIFARSFYYSYFSPALDMLPFFKKNSRQEIPEIYRYSLKVKFPERMIPDGKPKGRVVFFPGCMIDIVYQKTGISTIELLLALNFEVIIPKDLYCCGAPCYYLGDWDSMELIVRKNTSVINFYNADTVITSCATCTDVLGRIYGYIMPDYPIHAPVYDISKFLVENTDIITYYVSKGKKRNIERVTYHDPCHLKRGKDSVSDMPRMLLSAHPSIELVEMKDADMCCGGAGLFSIRHNELSVSISDLKAKNIYNTGAGIVATGCPSCQMHLKYALKRMGAGIEVVHTVSLISVRP